MDAGLYTVAFSAVKQQMRLDVIANNLANINTSGFKADMSDCLVSDPAKFDQKIALDSGKQAESMIDFTQGNIKSTGNALDLALSGGGFFCIETPDGIQYTRKGNFTLNKEGILVTQEGLPVLGDGGKISIDGLNVVVDDKGNILVDEDLSGKIKLVDFSDPSRLAKAGDSLFAPVGSDVAEAEAKGVTVRQGFLERSNVNAVKVMTEMIDALRGYESYQKVMQSMNDVTLKTINDVGRLA